VSLLSEEKLQRRGEKGRFSNRQVFRDKLSLNVVLGGMLRSFSEDFNGISPGGRIWKDSSDRAI
jgi:hypothetical protein